MSSRTVGAPPAPATTPGAYPKRWAAAIVMIVAALMDMIDGSIVNTALPTIGRGLQADSAQLQSVASTTTYPRPATSGSVARRAARILSARHRARSLVKIVRS
ncbi:hypothetical protein ACFXDH_09025 [Streptomyces sp. NPDC059467]|uniref:hypothetical protein n=1 Tax=Streptomyces sp. NPDC059467 TaxID=3346844 RepID=UPI00368A45A6